MISRWTILLRILLGLLSGHWDVRFECPFHGRTGNPKAKLIKTMASEVSLYEACSIGDGDEIDANILICISQRFSDLEDVNASRQENLKHWLAILVGSMIFFMQAGFAMICAGCVRKKNLQNTMLKVRMAHIFVLLYSVV